LRELRRRLSYPALVLLAGAIAAYIWREPVIELMRRPLNQPLFYTSPTAGFEFVMQVCLLAGFLVALPVFCYSLIRFIEPAFGAGLSRRAIASIIATSLLLVAAGVTFGYVISLPAALRFFSLVSTPDLQPLISTDRYLRFLIGHLAVFAAAFQLPLIILTINYLTPLKVRALSKARRYVIVAAFGLAVVIPSAPDPLSQLILALPVIALFELSVLLVRRINARRERRLDPSFAPPPSIPRLHSQPPPRKPPAKPAKPGVIDLRNR
jgi:sec-independent protein translocase protein TatC